MATYPVVNKTTGEQKEVVMSIHDWDQWKTDNPDWDRDYSDPSTVQAWEKLESGKTNSPTNIQSWNEILKKSEKSWWNTGSFA